MGLYLCTRGNFRSARGGTVGGGGGGGAFALQFPQNVTGADTTAPYAAIEFANPHNNGLPLWGTANNGITIVRKLLITSPSQQGYYQNIWYSQGDGNFSTANGYWGFHPYPTTGTNQGTSHIWEAAIGGFDYVDRFGNDAATTQANATALGYGNVYKQIMFISRIDANNKRLIFYHDATNTTNATVDVTFTATGYGESAPPSPLIYIGDSKWFAGFQHERFGGTLDSIKIMNGILSLADATSEVNDFSSMKTTAGSTGIWWGKNGFNSVNDLTCNYGTGRSWTRVDASNLITTVARL